MTLVIDPAKETGAEIKNRGARSAPARSIAKASFEVTT